MNLIFTTTGTTSNRYAKVSAVFSQLLHVHNTIHRWVSNQVEKLGLVKDGLGKALVEVMFHLRLQGRQIETLGVTFKELNNTGLQVSDRLDVVAFC